MPAKGAKWPPNCSPAHRPSREAIAPDAVALDGDVTPFRVPPRGAGRCRRWTALSLRVGRGRAGRRRGAERLRQEHAARARVRPAAAGQRPPAMRARGPDAAARPAAAVAERAGQRRARAAHRARAAPSRPARAPRRCSPSLAWTASSRPDLTSCPAACASAWPSCARCSRASRCCASTSPSARSTPSRAARCRPGWLRRARARAAQRAAGHPRRRGGGRAGRPRRRARPASRPRRRRARRRAGAPARAHLRRGERAARACCWTPSQRRRARMSGAGALRALPALVLVRAAAGRLGALRPGCRRSKRRAAGAARRRERALEQPRAAAPRTSWSRRRRSCWGWRWRWPAAWRRRSRVHVSRFCAARCTRCWSARRRSRSP